MPSQLPKIIEERIVLFSIRHPGLGRRRASSELDGETWGGIIVSPNGLWKVLCRHGLNTRAKRLGLIAGPYGIAPLMPTAIGKCDRRHGGSRPAPHLRLGILVPTAALALLAIAPAAMAAPKGASPSRGEDLRLPRMVDIACPSASLCVAVGGRQIVTLTNPTGGSEAWKINEVSPQVFTGYFSGVSCASVSLCVIAAGDGVLTSTNPAGREWKTTPFSSPGGAEIEGLSCPSASLCVAMSSNERQEMVITSTNPTGGPQAWSTSNIEGVGGSISCPSTALCVATGLHDVHFQTSTESGSRPAGQQELVTSTDPTGGPTAWSRVSIAGSTELVDVSCASVSLCVALDRGGGVASTTNPTGGAGAWSFVGGFPHLGWQTVSCGSITLCVAVGEEGNALISADPGGSAGSWTDELIYARPPNGPEESSNGVASVSCAPETTAGAPFCASVFANATVVTSSDPTGGSSAWTATALPESDLGAIIRGAGPVESVPVPVVGVRQTVSLVSGTVLVRLKGSSRFVALSAASSIRDGSEVDATNGRVIVTVATSTGTESAEAYGGRFVIEQERTGSDETHFVLSLALTGCPRVALPHGSAAAVASHSTHGPKSRHLWVSEGGGSWGTDGRYVSTSVEGTRWLTLDECFRSEVRVAAGKVKVHDLVRNRTKTITAGHHYTATATRHG